MKSKEILNKTPIRGKMSQEELSDEKRIGKSKNKLNQSVDLKQNLYTPSYLNAESSGRSMIEMLAALAVLALLSVAGITGYRYAMNKWYANETIYELNLRVQAISAVAQENKQSETNEIKMEMGSYTSLGYPITAYRMDNPRYFELSVEEVPVEVCKLILQAEWKLPIVIKVDNLAYNGNTNICEGLTESGEEMSTSNMVFQYGANLETDILPYRECQTDNDCAGKCGQCTSEGVCVTTCNAGQRCRQDTLTGSMVCCESDRWSGPYCCPSTMNGYCCDVNGKCCPWFKPLVDKNGNCYTCEEEKSIDVTGVNENCNACPNRELWHNLCVLPCHGEIRDSNGKCHDCDELEPIIIADAIDQCSTTCPNRVANGFYDRRCSLPCGAGTFTGGDGKCYSCDEEKNINVDQVSHHGCEQCDNRLKIGRFCILDCPNDQFRGDDGICYSCTESNPIRMTLAPTMCTDLCKNRIANGWMDYLCSLPCGAGTFTGGDGRCYSCDEEKNINVNQVSHHGCEQCPNTRNRYNDMCVPKCPSDTPLRGWDNKCYSCETTERVSVFNMTDACMECYEKRTLEGNYCVLK